MRIHETILGINKRNIKYIYEYNERKDYSLADDKLISKKLLQEHGFPTPKLLGEFAHFFELHSIPRSLAKNSDFVIKPSRGMGGAGILVFDRYENGKWITGSGEEYDDEAIYQHSSMILSGVFSLDSTIDVVMVEEKIQIDDLFTRIAYQGIPDIRVIVFNGEPVMAMLRIPTKKSKGKANLHMGGIGVGIRMSDGITYISDTYRKGVEINPDNGERVVGIKIPHWDKIKKLSSEIQKIVPLGYMGLDWVIDKRYGPQILEMNVRPGLEIQNINGIGLHGELQNIKEHNESN